MRARPSASASSASRPLDGAACSAIGSSRRANRQASANRHAAAACDSCPTQHRHRRRGDGVP